MSEKESLAIISHMITNVKNNVQEKAGCYTLVWGYATIITSILIYLGWIYIGAQWIMYGWGIIPIIGTIGTLILNKREKKKLVKTFLDSVINYIWIVFGVLGGMVSITAFIYNIPVLFFISQLMSAGIVLTGFVSKFKPYVYCGTIGVLLSFLCLYFRGAESVLIFAGIFFVTMIIPGHIANRVSNNLLKGKNIVESKL